LENFVDFGMGMWEWLCWECCRGILLLFFFTTVMLPSEIDWQGIAFKNRLDWPLLDNKDWVVRFYLIQYCRQELLHTWLFDNYKVGTF
jgi:hypothetical protein